MRASGSLELILICKALGAAVALLPLPAAAQCTRPIVSAENTDPGIPPDTMGTWSMQGGLRAGDVTADCGGTIFVGIDALIGYVDNLGVSTMIPGSLIVKNEFLGERSRFEAAGNLAIGSKGSMLIESSGQVSSPGGYIGVAFRDPGVNEDGNVGRVMINGGSGDHKSSWEIGSVLTLGASPGQPTFGTAGELSIVNGGVLDVGQRLVGTDSSVSVDGGGSYIRIRTPQVETASSTLAGMSRLIIGNEGQVQAYGGLQAYDRSTVDVSGAGSTLILGGGATIEGESKLSVRDGATWDTGAGAGPDAIVLIGSGGTTSQTATLQVNGAGSRWQSAIDTTVGNGGAGVLDIVNGGVVEDRNGAVGRQDQFGNFSLTHSSVELSGGSEWRNRGSFSMGTLDDVAILRGGHLSSQTGDLHFGQMLIDGTGSSWILGGDLSVLMPRTAQDHLDIRNGGLLEDVVGRHRSGDVIVDGAGSRWDNSGDLITGDGRILGNATVLVSGGALLTDNTGIIGDGRGSSSSIIVSGAHSLWSNRLDLALGAGGSAVLNVEEGGAVVNATGFLGMDNALATATVNGTSSIWTNTGDLWVGYDTGQGLLRVENGGSVFSRSGNVGNHPNTTADRAKYGVVIDGAGSSWSVTQGLEVGVGRPAGFHSRDSTGDLTVQNGGSLSSASARIGVRNVEQDGGIGSVRVSGLGSTWFNTGSLAVGGGGIGGIGELFISSGGEVTDGTGSPQAVAAQIGVGELSSPRADASGRISVDGANSTWLYNGDLEIGRNAGHGRLEITHGGLVVTGGSVIAGEGRNVFGSVQTRADITVKDPGSTWGVGGDFALGTSDATGVLTINGGGVVDILGDLTVGELGTILLGAGGRLSTRTLDLAGPNSLVWQGGILSAVSVLDGLVNDSGVFSPGHSPASSTIPGYAQHAGGTLEMEIGGLTVGVDYDHLAVRDTLDLDGVLRMVLVNGFQPIGGESFDLLDWTTERGLFASIDMPDLAPGLSWDVSDLYTIGVVRILPVPEPGTAGLVALGLIAIGATRRRIDG